jgi:Uma2 family endonuclease
MQGIQSPPRTIMEVYKMLPQGTLADVIEGSLFISPVPSTVHQRILGKIAIALSAFIEEHSLGEVFFSRGSVFLDEELNVIQPDITYIASDNSDIIKEDAVHGIPDLLIEVLSRGNASHDLIRKKDIYQKFGVKEYWIVNPDTKESTGFSLQNGIYIESGRFIGKIKSIVLNQEFSF